MADLINTDAPGTTEDGNQSTGDGTGASDQTAGATDQNSAQATGDGDQEQGGGVTPPKWTDQLSVEMRESEALKSFIKDNPKATLSDFAKAYGEKAGIVATLNTDAITVPGKDDPQEVWTKFYTSIGVPESEGGYNLEKFEHIGEFKELAEHFSKLVHGLKLTGVQATNMRKGIDALFEMHNKAVKTQDDDHAETSRKALETEYKSDYKAVAATAGEVFTRIASKEVIESMGKEKIEGTNKTTKDVMLNSPSMVGLLKGLESKVLEDSSLPGGGGGKEPEKDPRTGVPVLNIYDSPDMKKAMG